jgi:hypothetical protein
VGLLWTELTSLAYIPQVFFQQCEKARGTPFPSGQHHFTSSTVLAASALCSPRTTKAPRNCPLVRKTKYVTILPQLLFCFVCFPWYAVNCDKNIRWKIPEIICKSLKLVPIWECNEISHHPALHHKEHESLLCLIFQL